jgi:hypothetical protein
MKRWKAGNTTKGTDISYSGVAMLHVFQVYVYWAQLAGFSTCGRNLHSTCNCYDPISWLSQEAYKTWLTVVIEF